MHLDAKLLDAVASNSMDWSRLYAMTGSMTMSSKFAAWPPTVTVTSLPITCAQTMVTDSAMTGLTFPGIMDEPGCVSGKLISPSPQRGPDPSQRISLAIFIRLTATVRNCPLASTRESCADWASKWFLASLNAQPVSLEIIPITLAENFGWQFSPVPTAVPPNATSLNASCANLTRWMPSSICLA